MHRPMRVLLLTWALLVPTVASAQFEQASIAGVVRDESGAVLPGVTVEAMSPVLIEKVRAVVTDGTGQYRIVDLRSGVYDVTFSLPGFATIRREQITLSGSMTATVNAELQVGSLEETITVTGESPLVDVQNARQQQTLSADVISAIPSARGYTDLAVLVPSMTSENTLSGGLGANSNRGTLGAHGGASDGRIYVDGQSVGSAAAGNTSSYAPDAGATAAEVVVSASAGTAEAEAAGPMVNIVSKTGGNLFSGVLFTNGASSGMQGNNYSEELQNAGLRAPNELIKIWDVNFGLGGPVQQDRLWFFFSGRHLGNREYIAGMYYNKNAGDPTKWTYEPDFERRAFRDFTHKNVALRLTWQATQRDKFNIFWDEQSWCNECLGGGDATTSPEASGGRGAAYPNRLYQAAWTSPFTTRLLLEAGVSAYHAHHFGKQEKPTNDRDLIRVVEQAGLIPGLVYRSQNWQSNDGLSPRWRASMSYVTGAHSLKVGYQGSHFWRGDSKSFTNNHRLTYRFNNGVPNQLTMSIMGWASRPHVRSTSLFAQDQWTHGRLTLQAGLRYDHAYSYFVPQEVGPDRFLPVPITFPRLDGVKGFHDFNPRGGLAYDVFGTGKTALKVHVGRYVVNSGVGVEPYSDTNPLERLSTSTTRSWRDADSDYEPDCDLLNAAANGECGAWANQNFGKVDQSTTYDPTLLEGWGVRQGDWFAQVGVQQQILTRVSVALEYTHRWFFNQTVTDNLLVGPADYDRFSITAPEDPRLPSGGGYVIDGLYDVDPSLFGETEQFVTAASDFGDWNEYWHGVDFSVNARVSQNLTASGGFSTGRRITDTCDVNPRIDNPSELYCNVTEAFRTQVKAFAAYTIPGVDVQLSGTFQSRPGVRLAANYDVPTAVVAQTLGRNLAGGERNVRVNLVAPGTLYGDQINQVDARVAKVFRFGQRRIQFGFEVYNALNANAVQTYNQTYGPRWLTPTSIMPARFAKLSAQLEF